MRLSHEEVHAIKKTIASFDPGAVIYLFGSRVDDGKRGGDIDLLIVSQKIAFRNLIDIKLALYDFLGEQKIDIILARETKKPFIKIAMQKGIVL
jgi:predicted nucleotidyltransferase